MLFFEPGDDMPHFVQTLNFWILFAIIGAKYRQACRTSDAVLVETTSNL
jgi:hypothetical protein